MQRINQVAIVGGTHGNEFTGAYLVKKFTKFPELIQRPSFQIQTLLANPRAFQAVRRYIDKDLNRCFLQQDLENYKLNNYEEKRAKEIALGFKTDSQVDFILDLHSSTANMGMTIILVNDHPFNLGLAAYLTAIEPSIKVLTWFQPSQESYFLASLCKLGLAIEVGPIPPGTLNGSLFQKTEELVHRVLDYIDKYNQDAIASIGDTLRVYQHLGFVDYPKDEQGEITGMIHPLLQGRDYEELKPGDPMFLTLDGSTVYYEEESSVWPLFINEAAYYEKGIAMCLAEKKMVKL